MQRLIANSLLFFCVFLTLIIYSNTLNAPFVFDDIPNIVNNKATKELGFFTNVDKVFDVSFNESIRPFFLNRYIGYLTFAINYQQTGLDTISYHITNLVIHILNAVLVFLFIKITISYTHYSKELNLPEIYVDYFALAVATLFAVHPIQTQAVTYIVQRFTSLATLFYLLSLVLYAYWRVKYSDLRHPLIYIIALISVIFAMKTKEIAFTLPLMLFIYDLVFIKDTIKNRLLYLTPFLLCLSIIPLTIISTSGLEGINASNHFDISRWHYLFTQFTVVLKYINLLLLPINQAVDYEYPLYKSFFEPYVIVSFLLLTALFTISVYLVISNKINYLWRFVGFGILWFFIALSVESSIIPIADYIYEHRLYLPSVGFSIVVVSFFYKILVSINSFLLKKGLIVMFVFIILILSYATYIRNNVWTDEEWLWKDNISKQPLKARVYTNLSNYYYKKSDTQKAVDVLEQGFRLIKNNLFLYINLAIAYTANGDFEKANLLLKDMYEKYPDNKGWVYIRYGYLYFKQNQLYRAYEMFVNALKEKQYNYDIWVNISKILFRQGNYERALLFSKIAMLNNCINIDCLGLTAKILERLNRNNEARYYYSKMLEISPDIMNNFLNTGMNYMISGDNNNAKANFLLATKIDQNSSEAFYFLGLTEFKLSNFEEAKSHFYKSLELKTEYIHFAHYFLAKIYQKQGGKENAIKHIKKCIEAKPDYELAQKTLKDLDSN